MIGKKSILTRVTVICAVASGLIITPPVVATQPGVRSAVGEVIGVSPDGSGIAITATIGGLETIAGAIVTDRTVITVHGKQASIRDIKKGDRVILVYAYEKDNLYAKKIIKIIKK
jgi:hypothetical protein